MVTVLTALPPAARWLCRMVVSVAVWPWLSPGRARASCSRRSRSLSLWSVQGVTHCAQRGHPVPTKHRCRGTQDGGEDNWLETLMTWTDWGSGEGRCRGRRGRVEAGAEGLAIHASTNEGLLKQSTQRGLFHPQGRSFCETEGLCPRGWEEETPGKEEAV